MHGQRRMDRGWILGRLLPLNMKIQKKAGIYARLLMIMIFDD
jgi:hypothetical protein